MACLQHCRLQERFERRPTYRLEKCEPRCCNSRLARAPVPQLQKPC
ncbi:basic protein bp4 [Halobacterium salinarum R1]|uniref:Basic protein bp4 n=2 Tax=Halobacterium salinarum NRC-34001 TaxID=2886895 RepID=A0A510N611_HALSA|nr:basic protein bp4 [Halobacterium salinarum R1]DAC78121.1 TPA_inf: basic protein bp4 [Halobacterium salinarum NRC-1]